MDDVPSRRTESSSTENGEAARGIDAKAGSSLHRSNVSRTPEYTGADRTLSFKQRAEHIDDHAECEAALDDRRRATPSA